MPISELNKLCSCKCNINICLWCLLTFSIKDSGTSRGVQASWGPTSSAPWVTSLSPTFNRPLRSKAVRGGSNTALSRYHPSVSQTVGTGPSVLPAVSEVSTSHTHRTIVLAEESSLSVIFFRADLWLLSISTSYLINPVQLEYYIWGRF